MRPGLFILPFLSLILGAIAAAVASAFPSVSWVKPVAWTVALTPAIVWVVLDFDNFRLVFARRGSKYGASSGLNVILGLAVIVGIAFLANKPRFNKSFDATKAGVNTLSDQTIKILKKISDEKKNVSITAFVQQDSVETSFRELLALYQAHANDLTIEFVDPRDNPTRAMSEKVTTANTAIIKSGNLENRITTFNEEKLTNALVSVLKEKSKKVYFTKGHEEGDISSQEAAGFSAVVEELKNNKYEVDSLALLEMGKVPEDADLVVIAGPKYDFREEEARLLEEYINRGKPLVAFVDAVTPVPVLNQLLGKFGLKFNNDLLIMRPDDPRAALIGQGTALIGDFDKLSPLTRDYASRGDVILALPNTRSVEEVAGNANEMKVEVVAKSLPVIIRVKDVKRESDLKDIDSKIVEGSVGVIAVATGKTKAGPEVAKNESNPGSSKSDVDTSTSDGSSSKDIRIVAIGSTQLANNYGAQRPENRDMFLNIVSFATQDEDFISIRPKDVERSTLELTSAASQLSLMFVSYVYPLLFLLVGTYFWMRRRNA
jgi:ABC-type uncharacterized transport system involved in gliding motility auxiliary subunit